MAPELSRKEYEQGQPESRSQHHVEVTLPD